MKNKSFIGVAFIPAVFSHYVPKREQCITIFIMTIIIAEIVFFAPLVHLLSYPLLQCPVSPSIYTPAACFELCSFTPVLGEKDYREMLRFYPLFLLEALQT